MNGQAGAIDLLAAPATHGGAPVERIETHISLIFLAGAFAYKLKRAARFDYLDFSTPERRRACCEEEVRRNRRTAPQLYVGVLAITREADGRLALNGTGEPVDWVVQMRRFDQSGLLDRLAAANALDAAVMDTLGREIAAFHRAAPPRPDRGGARGMELVIDGNEAGLREFGDAFDRDAVPELAARSREEWRRCQPLLERRRLGGWVRLCHGDLHLGNIVLIDGRPILFDAIEFNDDIACTDVLYDLAFLLMDLRHRGLDGHANVAWNAYLEETADYDGLPLVPLFLSCRGAVRAKIGATASRMQPDSAEARALMRTSHQYLEEALRLLRHEPPVAVAIGGVSGTGKSTLASALAPLIGPPPGAVVLRSDVIRKQLCGVARLDRLGAAAYTPATSAKVYRELAGRARTILAAGHSVIVDATFIRAQDRHVIEAACSHAGVNLQGLWLDASDEVLRQRLAGRANDPSDADAAVLALQRKSVEASIRWEKLDAEKSPDVGNILTKIRSYAGKSATSRLV